MPKYYPNFHRSQAQPRYSAGKWRNRQQEASTSQSSIRAQTQPEGSCLRIPTRILHKVLERYHLTVQPSSPSWDRENDETRTRRCGSGSGTRGSDNEDSDTDVDVDADAPHRAESERTQLLCKLQTAYWYYIDVECKLRPHELPFCSFTDFVAQCWTSLSALRRFVPDRSAVGREVHKFIVYRKNMPTAGCLVMSESGRCLFIKGFDLESYSLPKGKVEPGETLEEAAVREVREETGLDVSEWLDASVHWEVKPWSESHNRNIRNATCHIFLAKVPEWVEANARVPRTARVHREVNKLRWIPLADVSRDRPHRLCQQVHAREGGVSLSALARKIVALLGEEDGEGGPRPAQRCVSPQLLVATAEVLAAAAEREPEREPELARSGSNSPVQARDDAIPVLAHAEQEETASERSVEETFHVFPPTQQTQAGEPTVSPSLRLSILIGANEDEDDGDDQTHRKPESPIALSPREILAHPHCTSPTITETHVTTFECEKE